MKKFIIIFSVWIVSFFLINKFSVNFMPDRTSYELPTGISIPARFTFLPFLNYDGRNYLDIANQGYFQKGIYNLRAFFPLYPLSIAAIVNLTGINVVFSGLIISIVSTIASIYLLYKLVKEEYGKDISGKAVLILLTFPTSYYLVSYYPESLYLFLSLAFFWFLNKGKFGYAAIFAGLASATRITGVVLSLVVLFEGVKYFLEKKKFPFIVLISPFGLIGYSIYSYITVHDPLTFLHSWSIYGKSFSIFGPVLSMFNGIKNVFIGSQPYYDSPFVYPVSILELLSLVFLIAVIIFSFKKIRFSYWLYMVASSYIYLAGGVLQSLPRYILVLFPIFIFLAKILNKKWFIVYNIIAAVLLILLSAIFLRGYWVA